MMVAGVVQNEDDLSSRSGADAMNLLEQLEEGFPIEGFILSLKRKLPVTQTYGSEIPRALSRGMMKENGVLQLRRNPHATGGAVKLEVHLVTHPYVAIRICKVRTQFFLKSS